MAIVNLFDSCPNTTTLADALRKSIVEDTVTGDVMINVNVIGSSASSNPVLIGDKWRLYQSGDDLLVQKDVGGVWTTVDTYLY